MLVSAIAHYSIPNGINSTNLGVVQPPKNVSNQTNNSFGSDSGQQTNQPVQNGIYLTGEFYKLISLASFVQNNIITGINQNNGNEACKKPFNTLA